MIFLHTIKVGSKNLSDPFSFRHLRRLTFSKHLSYFDDNVRIIRNELFLWILSMCKLQQITHKLNIKPERCANSDESLISLRYVNEWFAWVCISIKFTKIWFLPLIRVYFYIQQTLYNKLSIIYRSKTFDRCILTETLRIK